MGSLFDTLYDILFQPLIAMKNIGEQKPISQAIIAFLGSIVLPIWALYFSLKMIDMPEMVNVVIAIKVVSGIMIWAMGSAIWHLIAEFFGGRGSAVGLFAALGFVYIPWIFIIPLWALTTLMPTSSKVLLMTISVLAVLLWSLYLHVIAIKEVHQLSTATSVLVMLTPMLFVGLVCVITFIFIGSAITHMPMGL